jgi:endoglucanase
METKLGVWALVSVLAFSVVGCSGAGVGSASETPGEANVDSVTGALTTTYQAESAFDLEEGVVETVNAGYTGSGYVNIDNDPNTFAWYIINQPSAKTVAVTVRYANGTAVNRPFDVHANGHSSIRASGAPTGSWTTWKTVTVNVPVDAGSNDFFFSSVTADGMPNIDKFDITR